MSDLPHLHAVILAGGSGTRLWPLSRPDAPKQFLQLPNGNSMIQETLTRVGSLASPEQCWVVTGRGMVESVHEHLPAVPPKHILGEPIGRSTAPAISWVAATIARKNPEAVMASFHADHAIVNVDALQQSLRFAYELAEQGYLVTLGIKPTAPETGYGYIQYANAIHIGHNHQAFHAERFVEKPDIETAQSYLQDGHYVWNSGIFIWKVETILAELHTHLPELAHAIDTIAAATGTVHERATLDELWPKLTPISIDHGVLEKTKNLIVIPVDIGWNDVGNWEQYGALFPANEQGIRSVGHHRDLDSQNVFVYNTTPRQVYTIGLQDTIVVELDNVTVICHKEHVQRVKELAGTISPLNV